MPGRRLREGVEALLNLAESLLSKGFEERTPLIHVALPTGYGKSEASILLAEKIAELEERSPVERLIHVIPTKYLVEDLTRRARERGLPALAQSMFTNPSLKAPYFIQPLIFTTLDSYAMNFYKVPVAEIRSIAAGLSLGHSEIARYSILTAINIFDEYHIFVPGDTPSEDPEFEDKAWTVLSTIISDLIVAGAPVILETATPRAEALHLLKQWIPPRKLLTYEIIYDYSGALKETQERKVVSDREFAEGVFERRFRTTVEENSIREKAIEVAKLEGDSILIVTNTVKDAVEVYRALREKTEAFLLHSRLTVGDRARRIREVERRLKRKKPVILVSTQVIEVGVNLDFRTLVSAAAPISSLVQRIGRVGRGVYEKEGVFEIRIVYDPEEEKKGLYNGVYSTEAVRSTISLLKSIKEREKEISWKIPSSENLSVEGLELVPYNKIAEKIYASLKIGINGSLSDILRLLTQPHIRSETAVSLMMRLGGFIRDSFILPVYTPSETPSPESPLDEFRIERIVPIKADALGVSFIRKPQPSIRVDFNRLREVILCEDERIMAILSGPRDELRFEYISEGELKKLLVRMNIHRERWRFASLEALVARPESYDREVGLIT